VTEWSVVAVALAVALGARLAAGVPFPVVLLAAAAAGTAVARRPVRRAGVPAGPLPWWTVVLVALGLALAATWRAHSAVEALSAPLPATVQGLATLRSDPDPVPGGTVAVLEVGARRYRAQLPAAGLTGLLAGDRLEVVGRPSPLHGVDPGWQQSQHLAGRLSVRSTRPGPPPAWWDVVAGAVRRRIAAGADALPEDQRTLYLGLVVGDDRGQPPLLRHQFRASGLAHLLAVSGQNVAFVLLACSPVLGRLPFRWRTAGAAVALALFVLVARAEASVLRAAAMAGVVVLAVALGRRVRAGRAAAVAVVALLLVDPLLVRSVGFRLSVAATAGLVLLSRPLAARLPGPRPLAAAAAVSLAAQLATAPVLVPLAGGVPAVGVLANLLAVPAAGLVMVLGLTLGPFAGLLRPDVAQVLMWPVSLLVGWVGRVAAAAAAVPLPLLDVSRLLVLAAGLAAAVLVRQLAAPRSVTWFVAAGAAAAGAVLALWPVTYAPGRHEVAPGAVLVLGECGGRVLDVGGATGRTDRLLDALTRADVHRADVLVARPGRTGAATARDVAASVRVQQVVVAADAAPAGFMPLAGRSLQVGGLVVSAPAARDGPARTAVSGAPCTVGP
jgi:competence protein ComEC